MHLIYMDHIVFVIPLARVFGIGACTALHVAQGRKVNECQTINNSYHRNNIAQEPLQ